MTGIDRMLRKKIGDFYLMKQIGAGGRSDVYLGINPRTREKRAFKIFRKCASVVPFAYGLFSREVDVIRDLSHPGIVKILDSGIIDSSYYYSMEFMTGGNLAGHLERRRIPVAAAIDLFTQICKAMAYAHDHGVVHRNLKPSNVLLSAAGNPVISDFGIARTPDLNPNPIARTGKILRTIAYLAPEQRLSSKNTGFQADVFALGVLFYQMLMGFLPLGTFVWPIEVHPDFPGYLQSALEWCLAIDPDKRLGHAGLLLSQLERWPGNGEIKTRKYCVPPYAGWSTAVDRDVPVTKADRIELWFKVLRTGSTRERLATVREMVDELSPAEAKTIVKLYADEADHVRWGLIRVLGELKIEAATSLILNDLDNPFYTECEIDALGKIGSHEAYNPMREFVAKHPERAVIAMVPLARTGKKRAIRTLEQYLSHETAAVRQAAVRALASIESAEALVILKEHLCVERDESVRSTLIQAVHALQRSLHPALKLSVQESPAGDRPIVA